MSDSEAHDSGSIERILYIMARLRDPDGGCPWDLEQDFRTIAPYTIEEAYEVSDAIEREAWPELMDELGDLLFQVVFHARMAEEANHFSFADVVRAISDKMERRHPHVFAEAAVRDAAAQTVAWEEQKARGRESAGDDSALAGIARGMPEWLRALKLQRRAARVGFDWDRRDEVLDKLEEEVREIREAEAESTAAVEEEFGDFLFAVLNLSRHLKVDAGRALRSANAKFERRFRAMEREAEERGTSLAALDLEAMEALWQVVKGREHGRG